ncbi:hypothetical protein CBM2588_A130170 [Cupriavidus taiwanensis]|nr:hypothetical protein CBM2588_A130170 [Cupriavidus taiwanensis]SPD43840.1 protein of unknown function [Cupriavidus taiwanensis]
MGLGSSIGLVSRSGGTNAGTVPRPRALALGTRKSLKTKGIRRRCRLATGAGAARGRVRCDGPRPTSAAQVLVPMRQSRARPARAHAKRARVPRHAALAWFAHALGAH